jgi:poly-gamma-glutamate synthase PgsB/CapB
VFSALGHPLISKTTGNEAMFLHAHAFGEVREMFLFRPYDKATIWEQLDLAVLASRLGAKVFLWECMGLTPAYVRVLQRHWMRDDIGTITNTYPDHEDVQGPAGRNIPEVMTNFIPEDALLITSEEQMRPILAEAAHELDTAVDTVGWLEAGLIPQEFLARFPYEEHPYNIALVTRMAQRLGISPDVAVKEMADRVVQDIGALKVYPEATVRTRRLEFVLGNSANERFGALGNWTRLGFDRHDPVEEPDLWITTVVNNRADRVPRSRVFASILVKDISADRHVLIGSNLEGMEGFIREAWDELAPSLTLTPPDQSGVDPLAQLEQYARRFRVVHRPDQLASIEEVLRASGRPDDDGFAEHLERCKRQLSEYEALASELRSGGPTALLDARLREQLWSWFKDKIVVVPNYHASGEEIVRLLADMTPPGFRNRIMGMQNIKGTGLDFVYRWHAWEGVAQACADIGSGEEGRRKRGLQVLSRFREYGILSAERVDDLVRQLREDGTLQGEIERNQVSLIEAQLHDQLARFSQSTAAGEVGGGKRWMDRLEAILDAGDAVRRRKKANRIYRDLTAERISSERAASELKKLTTRQKGGWLHSSIGSAKGARKATGQPSR